MSESVTPPGRSPNDVGEAATRDTVSSKAVPSKTEPTESVTNVSPPPARFAGRLLRLLPYAMMAVLLITLLWDRFAVTSLRQVLGPVSVIVALTPEPATVGSAILHFQINTADDRQPIENARLSIVQQTGDMRHPLESVQKAVSGAHEVTFEVPASGTTLLEVQVSAMAPIGTLTYEVQAGQAGVKLVKTTLAGVGQ